MHHACPIVNSAYRAFENLGNDALVRLSQILGDSKRGTPPVIPISKSAWWAGVKAGKYPKPIKLGPRTTAWRVSEIRDLIALATGERPAHE